MHVPITKNMIIFWFFGCVFGLSVSLILQVLQQQQFYKFSQHAYSHKDFENEEDPDEIVVFHKNESAHKDDDLVARKMAENIRVLCWVMTQPANHKKKVHNEV